MTVPPDQNRPPIEGASGAETDQLVGGVERVTFHNEENGYCVLKISVKGRSEPVTLVGNVPRVTPGELLEASGEWINSTDYGKQFKATSITTRPPKSKVGLERFLASGLIAGIGKTYAKRIVEKFGEDVFEIIEHHSARLEEVPGVGKKRRLEIKESWRTQKAIHGIMVFLHEHGISTARAVRIFKTYGDQAEDILRKDPYQIARDINGIGFQGADKIARSLGIEAGSEKRVRAGVMHVLNQAASSGHTALPRLELLPQAAEMLDIDAGPVEAAVERLLIDADLIAEHGMVYMANLHKAETRIADRVRELQDAPASYPPILADRAIEWVQQENGIDLAAGQIAAIKAALTEKVLIITGGPGVGKTTVLNSILKVLGAKDVSPVLAAPTGRAARRLSESTGLEAATLHRLLEYRPDAGWARNRQRPLEADLVVVDEASMIDVTLMSFLLDAVPRGGHLLLVGDADQLPSVGPGTVLNDMIASGAIPVARLTEIYRQAAESRIITAAHAMNAGQMPEIESQSKDADFFFFERDEPEALRELLVDLVADRLPKRFGVDGVGDIQVLTPMNRNALGTKALNDALQARLNPANAMGWEVERFGVTYRVGDKVIQTRNNYDKDIYNGDIGRIRRIDSEPTKVIVEFDGDRRAEFEPGDLDELSLAYAITIHKSQGSEFPVVVMPVSTQHYVMLQRNLLYTGITRGKTLVVLVGQKRALQMAVDNVGGNVRHSGLKLRLEELVV